MTCTSAPFAVYSAVYPSAVRYVPDLMESIKPQLSSDFELVLALDGVSPDEIDFVDGTVLLEFSGKSIAEVRSESFSFLSRNYEGSVLVDADDRLREGRLSGAIRSLENVGLSACGLELVDAHCRPLGKTLVLPQEFRSRDVLAYNVFGLSNTAYRADVLALGKDIPAETELVDWYLATMALARGFSFGFERTLGMDYRQHGSNFTRTFAPFDRQLILRSLEKVARHYELIAERPEMLSSRFVGALQSTRERLARFASQMNHEEVMGHYVDALNKKYETMWWWSWIARPELEDLWM